MAHDARVRNAAPILRPDQSYGAVTDQLAGIVLDPVVSRRAWAALAASACLLVVFVVAVVVLFRDGVGVWGINQPVHWGLAIINTVWWIGIGMTGTIVSAGLLVHKPWRNSLNRFAETVTLFAALCASLFPVLHLGRPWLFYWMAPYTGTNQVWPQFRSPLTWDFFGFVSYVLLSVLFWYVGMIPDMAVLRDRARRRGGRWFYGLLALGWRGSAVHWRRWRQLYLVIAGLAVPHVFMVHSGTAMLFAASLQPGWHTTILPFYFVCGAVFSGFAVISMLAVAVRAVFELENLITLRHIDYLARAMMVTGLLTLYGYLAEAFTVVYSGEAADIDTLFDRFGGTYAWSYWGAVVLNFATLQLFWWPAVRRRPLAVAAVGLAVTVGMWLERYMILLTGLYRGHVPAMWREYQATLWDWALLAGTVGLFLFLLLVFLRVFPVISIVEVKETLHEAKTEAGRG